MDEVDRNRLEEFRQLRQEVRHSEEYLIVGIDIAKDRHHAFLGTATGKTLLRRLVFSNDHEGFRKLLDQAEALRAQHGLKKVVYGMEPTANYHKPLGEYLITLGRTVVLVSGVTVKRNRESLDGRWDKHDTKDAANVADLISQGKCLYYEYPSAELRGLRGLLSLKRRLKKQEHGYKVRIRNHLIAQYFPEMDRDYERLGAVGLSIVRWCFPASQITELDVEPFIQRVTSRRIRVETRRRLEEVWEKAGASIGCEGVPGMEHEAKVMVEGLRQIREVIKETEDKIQQLCEQFPEYPYVLTIPGFGPDVSAKVLGAIGDPNRFQNGKQVLKMGGLDLSADRSGKDSDKAIPEISKRGKADLRYALYQAALIASVKNRDFMIYYTNKLRGREREKGIHVKMRVKLAAKLLVIAWTLMKKKEKFNPAYLNAE
ncbi:MAG: IS110 family transposase [Deltaproteobacteria bacterium RBG_16_50_11]|nr:MAG: IS110 family transposase [Deltaproteobacteria bacterium RBG_16_50_11]